MRFALTCVVKESNVRLVGPLGAHVQLLGMQTVVTADSDKVRRRVQLPLLNVVLIVVERRKRPL